ncbi:uncharacterized protein PGTG_06850 [Puccinia graminis f. sp. tritici CRL 75-36-700-3]|uniref:Uncharacterized protein n=1 Tax=Puccinia graminis f. sp. tritici (strain CRL 75-36-700-3 / race SCCL) TaxID=418459 RepID=E3KA63_PUCGT|nr:uncharacterized protein PGTG_06850 [Puccinia graminis f. sp. tritici CRL 75-36-700-3]EFP81229.1 hypothetical protein PGTG_06850 [Puccinia graminis f. sp. tritici CRL 75-36-700-3]
MPGYSDTTDSYDHDGSFHSYRSGSPLAHGFPNAAQLPPASQLYTHSMPPTRRLSEYPPPASQAPSVFCNWPANPQAPNGPAVSTPTAWNDSSPDQDQPRLSLAHHHGPTLAHQVLPVEKGQQLPTLGLFSSGRPPLPRSRMFQCDITFLIYCAKKNKQKKTVWTSLKSDVDMSISFDCQTINLNQFQHLVSTECTGPYPKLPELLEHCTHSSPPSIRWVGYMGRNPNWLKTGSQSVADPPTFLAWIQEIIKSGVKKGGVYLKMANPSNEKKLAASNDSIAATVQRHEAQVATARAAFGSQPVPSGAAAPSESQAIGQGLFDLNEDAEDSCDKAFDARKIIEEDIFKKYIGNVGVDARHTVYPHPTDVNRYIILTSGNVASWARAIQAKECGVSLTSPPRCLKYYHQKTRASNLSQARGGPQPAEVPSSTSDVMAMTPEMVSEVVEICHQTLARKRPHSPSLSGSPVGVARGEGELGDYLDFAGIAKKEETLGVLARHGVDSYDMFQDGFMTPDQLNTLGLPVGTLAKLCRNVARYEQSLAFPRE